MKFLDQLSSLPRTVVFTSSLIFVVIVGIVDRTFGPTITFSLFYLMPVGIAGWACGLWYGVACGVVGASLRLWADMTWWPQLSPAVHGWNTGGRLTNFSAVALMISYIQKRFSERLTRAEAKYSRIVETAIEGIIATDRNFSIRFANGRAAAYLGYPVDALVGTNLLHLVTDSFSRLTIEAISNSTNVGNRAPSEICFARNDGKPLWALVSTNIHSDTSTGSEEIVFLLTDISDRKKSEEEELRSRYSQISAMQYLSSVLSLSVQLEERLTRALDTVLEVTKFSGGAIFLLEKDASLTLQHHKSFPPDELRNLVAWHSRTMYGPEGKAPILPKFIGDSTGLTMSEVNGLELGNIKAFATIPLVSKGSVVGVIDIGSYSPHQFSNDEELMLQTFGRQIGIAVENAKLLDDANQREKQVRQLSIDLARVQEDERKTFARDLHDGLSQILTTLKIMSELALKQQRSDPDGTEHHLRDVIALADEAQTEAKQIAYGLRPAILDDFGLKAAIPMLTTRFERRTGVTVELHLPPDEVRFDSLVETNIFRIVQELLANVAKHSGATRVTVQLLERNGMVALNVADNGKGLNISTLPPHPNGEEHSGLRNLQERIELLGGVLRTESLPDQGTEFLIELPSGFTRTGDNHSTL